MLKRTSARSLESPARPPVVTDTLGTDALRALPVPSEANLTLSVRTLNISHGKGTSSQPRVAPEEIKSLRREPG